MSRLKIKRNGKLVPLDPKVETEEEMIKRLEQESIITMAALADKHEETLKLKEENEELKLMSLAALKGVAELYEEVNQLSTK